MEVISNASSVLQLGTAAIPLCNCIFPSNYTGSEKGISQVFHNSVLLGIHQAWGNLIPKITHLTSLWKCGKNKNLICNPAFDQHSLQSVFIFFSEDTHWRTASVQGRKQGKKKVESLSVVGPSWTYICCGVVCIVSIVKNSAYSQLSPQLDYVVSKYDARKRRICYREKN